MKHLIYTFSLFISITASTQNNPYQWYPLGNMDSFDEIIVMYNDGQGHLYFGGDFDEIFGEDIGGVAMWDGTEIHDLGFPNSGYIYDIDKIGDTLYVGGDFYDAGLDMRDVARYYDGNWHSMGDLRDQGGTNSVVYAIEVVNGDLFVGGDFEEVYQLNGDEIAAYNIVKWKGGKWHVLNGAGLEDIVNDMQEHNGRLYVAGDFYENYAGSESFNYVVEYDPAGNDWLPLVDKNTGVDGLEDYAQSILVTDTAIFVGGWFDEAGGKSAPYIARYSNGEWHPNYGWTLDDPAYKMIFYKDQLYVGGSFQLDDPNGEEINDIAVLIDTSWYDLGVGLDYKTAGSVSALATFDSSLYIAGSFDGGGGVLSNNLIRVVKRDTSSSTGIVEFNSSENIEISPNPAYSYVNFSLDNTDIKVIEISLYNIIGTRVHSFGQRTIPPGTKGKVRLSLPTLPPSTYFLKVTSKNETIVRPLIIHR